jgi:hypothetical protein
VGTLDIQVHCINLEDTVGFAAPRCRSPTWRIADPIAFQLRGATSLTSEPAARQAVPPTKLVDATRRGYSNKRMKGTSVKVDVIKELTQNAETLQ